MQKIIERKPQVLDQGGDRPVSAAIDGITLELIWHRLVSIVDESAAALVRTSFSSIVRESNDFACVITDAEGYSVAQATNSIPSFIGTAPRTIRYFLQEFPAESLRATSLSPMTFGLAPDTYPTSRSRGRFFSRGSL